MKFHSILVAAVAVAGFGTVSAQEATPDTWLNVPSTASRADVRADAIEALHAGEIRYGEATRFDDLMFDSHVSRTRVAAEAREALELGLLARGERNVKFTPAQRKQIRQAGQEAVAPQR